MFHFGGFPSLYYLIHIMILDSSSRWFPNSEICGSILIYSSPQLIAVSHVLLRLPMPRHSPYALFRLNFPIFINLSIYALLSQIIFSVVVYFSTVFFAFCAKCSFLPTLLSERPVLFFYSSLEDNISLFSIICFVFVLYSVFNEHIPYIQ